MRSALPFGLLVALLIALSVFLAGLAANAALARDDVDTLDTKLVSLIRADYSADAMYSDLGRLAPGIIEAARSDEERLQAGATDIEIVPAVRRLPAPIAGAQPPRDSVTPVISDTPTPGETPTPGSTPTPGTTPGPGATPKPEPTPTPVATPRPDPSPTPVPTPTPLPPAISGTFYLHNNPTPPAASTNHQSLLAFDQTAPTASTLWNYDVDYDAMPGRTIQRGGSGHKESDPEKYQSWRGPVLDSPARVSGSVVVHLSAAMGNFALEGTAVLDVYLRDCSGDACTLISSDERSRSSWTGSLGGWKQLNFNLTVSGYTVAAGHRLELKVITDEASTGDVMIAYDTKSYDSQVIF